MSSPLLAHCWGWEVEDANTLWLCAVSGRLWAVAFPADLQLTAAASPVRNRFGIQLVGAMVTPPLPPKARRNENLDKIDMPLHDIIKLNRKEGNRRLQQSGTRQFRMVRWRIQQNSGFGETSVSHRGRVLPGKRHPYGVALQSGKQVAFKKKSYESSTSK